MIIRIDYDNDMILIDEKHIDDDSPFFELPINMKNAPKFFIELCNMLVGEYEDNKNPSLSLEKQDDGKVSGIEEY